MFHLVQCHMSNQLCYLRLVKSKETCPGKNYDNVERDVSSLNSIRGILNHHCHDSEDRWHYPGARHQGFVMMRIVGVPLRDCMSGKLSSVLKTIKRKRRVL
jgi:hypothetical protein